MYTIEECSELYGSMKNIEHFAKYLTTDFKPFSDEIFIHIETNIENIENLMERICITVLHYSIFNSNKAILILTKSFSDAKHMKKQIYDLYSKLPLVLRTGITQNNMSYIRFDTGSFIICQSGTKFSGKGMTISSLIINDFDKIKKNTELWQALMPAVSPFCDKIIITEETKTDKLFNRFSHQ